MSGFIKPTVGGGNADNIPKEQLENQVVAFVLHEVADVETSYGPSTRADLHIVLPETGEVDDSWVVFGNLARQLARCVGNKTGTGSIVRVIKGAGRNNSTFWGCEAISDPEFNEAIKLMDEKNINPMSGNVPADSPF